MGIDMNGKEGRIGRTDRGHKLTFSTLCLL